MAKANINIVDDFVNEYTWCIFVLLWAKTVKVEERHQASEPLIRARSLLPVSTAQDPAKQNQHSDPWQNQADYHILIAETL